MKTKPHQSVLLDEVVTAFDGVAINHFVDATLGIGGHTRALLEAHPEIVKVVGFDQDPTARALAAENLKPWESKLNIVAANFKELEMRLKSLGIDKVDGILMDLGVSSMQLDMPEKGFSFMHEGPLDMRMDPSNPLTAEVIVNSWPEQELARVIRDYGEEKQWRAAARAIVAERSVQPFKTTKDLAQKLYPVLMRKSKKGINPLTLLFQGIRIAVNGELEVLEAALPQALRMLRKGGRLAVISFHSLEDRIVKRFFQHAASDKEETRGLAGLFRDKDPTVNILTKKPIEAGDEEIAANPRARSAKLRVVEKR